MRIDRKIIETAPDTSRGRSMFSLEQRGIVDRDVDQQILEGRVDFAVHNMKDVPIVDRSARLVIASVPERGSPAEALVSSGDRRLKDLTKGSKVGTSSPIRVAQLRRVRPDLTLEPLWGEVETRIGRVDKGEFDATILAEAGLAKLGIAERVSERLPIEEFMPAPGQGALAIIARRDNLKVIETLNAVEHPPTRVEVDAERELVRILEGTSKVPVGGLAAVRGDQIHVRACILSADGTERLFSERRGPSNEGVGLAREIGQELIAKGANRIEMTWRNARR